MNVRGTLSVVGTPHNDTLVVQFDGSHVKATANGKSVSFKRSKVHRIYMESFGGDDHVTNDTNLPSTIRGDNGDDVLTGGSADDSIVGGAGADSMDGGEEDDVLHGGLDNDTLRGGTGRDKLFGDGGNDRILARLGSTDILDGGEGTDTATGDNRDLLRSIERFNP